MQALRRFWTPWFHPRRHKIQAAVSHVEKRSRLYRHTATSMVTLEKGGVLQRLCPEESGKLRDAMEQLALTHGPDALLAGEYIVEMSTKVGSCSSRSVTSAASPVGAFR